MRRIDGLEGKILKKYIKGNIVDAEDKVYLERMANTGLVKYGYDIEKRETTAKTTSLGYSSIF